jgi:arylsulfatase A-like enzyme
MKAIMVMFDSLNRRMLEPYAQCASGCDWVKTPNFRRLAEKAVTFDNMYAGSLPCMPARRELHTGRINFLHRSWGPVEPFDDSMPELLQRHDVYTHLISDHYHYWEDGGATFHQRYSSWEIVRGQEGDKWKAQVEDPVFPPHLGHVSRQDEINRPYMSNDCHPQKQVFDLGLEFLEKNHAADSWFLQLEAFDPHEPFCSPESFRDLYPHNWDGPRFDWPNTGAVTEEAAAVEHMRKEYAALISLCDASLGRVLDFMDSHDMWKDTMLIVNTDHGYLLSEHDVWGKNMHPWYDELVHIPLFVWDPRQGTASGARRKALCQTIDIAPTLLDFFGAPIPPDMEGKSLSIVLQNDTPIREAALFGAHGGMANVTDGRYVYMRDHNPENKPLYEYTHIPTRMMGRFSPQEMRNLTLAAPFSFTKGDPVMKIEAAGMRMPGAPASHGTRLYDLESDPEQKTPIEDEAAEERMKALLIKLMKENDAPPEQYVRLGLAKPEMPELPLAIKSMMTKEQLAGMMKMFTGRN